MSDNGATGSGSERVIIIGGGMAGLASALSLSKIGVETTVVERDEPPVDLVPDTAFESWKRPGVPQLHHTHIFLARLQTIVRDHHPELMEELEEAGITRSSLDQVLPPSMGESYVARPDDGDLLHLWGRRATFEYVLRKHVGRSSRVRFVHGARVEGLVVEDVGQHRAVRGVEVRHQGRTETLPADVVIDASGVRSKVADWLRGKGATIRTEILPSPCSYYCRHFAQRDPSVEPPRRGTGASLDYLVFGTFFAERGTFSIAFACPEIERELSETIRRPEGFDHLCSQIPLLQAWTSRAEPISRVLGGAGLANRWNHYPRSHDPQPLGFFPVGDSYVQTNPIFGRGCSMAFLQATILAEAFRTEVDPAARARRYHARVWSLLRPHFDFCVAADRAILARAKMARGEPVPFVERFVSNLYQEAFVPALERDQAVAREWIKAQQMREVSRAWVGLFTLLRVILIWLGRLFQSTRGVQATYGPSREEMVRSLPSHAPEAAE